MARSTVLASAAVLFAFGCTAVQAQWEFVSRSSNIACEITSGLGGSNNCVTDGAGRHTNNEECTVRWTGPAMRLNVQQFSMEANYDFITVGNPSRRYSGNTRPDNVPVFNGGTLQYTSDGSVTNEGFLICGVPCDQPSCGVTTPDPGQFTSEFWSIINGQQYCQLSGDNGECVTDGAGRHGNRERCDFRAMTDMILDVREFDLEGGYDWITVNHLNQRFSGNGDGPNGRRVPQGQVITFTTDGSVTNQGFTICANLCAGVTCPAPEECHLQGECSDEDGLCSTPLKPAGANCDDGNPATVNDSCNANGQCNGELLQCGPGEGFAPNSGAGTCTMCVAGQTFQPSVTPHRNPCQSVAQCGPGTEPRHAGSRVSDVECRPCPNGHYKPGPGNTVCIVTTRCPAGQEQATPGTPTTDRTCQACGVGQFKASQGQHACIPFTACDVGAEVTQTGTPSQDQVCETCDDGFFSAHPTVSCRAHTECAAGQELVRLASGTTDNVCHPCVDGSTYSPGRTRCQALTVCEPGEYETAAPTTSTDRVCGTCTPGTFSVTGLEPSCLPFTQCSAGSRDLQSGDTTKDTTCEPCIVGATFSTAADSSECMRVAECGIGEHEMVAPTRSSDRTCMTCPSSSFKDDPSAAHCSPHTVCAPFAGGCAVSPETGCYTAVPGTARTDAVCRPLTECDWAVEWEYHPMAPRSDRVCSPALQCVQDAEYESAPLTRTSDRVCLPITVCAGNEYEVRAYTNTTDRVCDDVMNSPNAVAAGSLSPTGGTITGVLVAIVVVALIAVVFFMRRGGGGGSSPGRDTTAFENPLYASTGGVAAAGESMTDGGPAYPEESGGYQDVAPDFEEGVYDPSAPTANFDAPQEAAYMDVSANPMGGEAMGGFDDNYVDTAIYDSATGQDATGGYMEMGAEDI